MRRNKRILLIAVVSALAVVSAIAIVLVYRWQQPRIRERIIAILSENLDSNVELGDVDVSLGLIVRVTAHGLVLRHREHPEAAPLIAVDRFSAEVPITALLHKPIHVASISLVGLHITIPPRHHDDHDDADKDDADKGEQLQLPERSRLSGKLGRPTPVIVDRLTSDDAVLEIGVRKPGRPPRIFQIHRVLLTAAAFDRPTQFHAELTNPIPSGLIVADGTFGPWQPYEPALTKVAGSYIFNNADLSTIDGIGGHLDSTGQFTGRLEQISVKGETRTPDFTLDIGGEPLPLNTTFTAIVDGTNGDTVLDAVSATLGHTPIQARGGVVHMGTEKDRTVELDARIDNGRLEDILRLALKDEPPAMFGGLHLETHLELPPGKGKVPLRLKLNGHFRVAEARFSSNTVRSEDRRAVSASARRAGGHERRERRVAPAGRLRAGRRRALIEPRLVRRAWRGHPDGGDLSPRARHRGLRRHRAPRRPRLGDGHRLETPAAQDPRSPVLARRRRHSAADQRHRARQQAELQGGSRKDLSSRRSAKEKAVNRSLARRVRLS